MEVLGELGGFSGTGFGDDDEDLVFFDGFEEFGAVLVNWEGFTSFVYALSCIKSRMSIRLSK